MSNNILTIFYFEIHLSQVIRKLPYSLVYCYIYDLFTLQCLVYTLSDIQDTCTYIQYNQFCGLFEWKKCISYRDRDITREKNKGQHTDNTKDNYSL